MSNHDDGGARNECQETFDDLLFTFHIDRGSGFVEDKEPGFSQYGLRQRDALAFAARNQGATLADYRVETHVQSPHELICTGKRESAPHLVSLTLLMGMTIGLTHALMINELRLPPFIATLATMAGLRSLATLLCQNKTINVPFDAYRVLGKELWITLSIFSASRSS